MYETMRCQLCWVAWRRPVVLGRKPRLCPTCSINYSQRLQVRRRPVSKAVELTDAGRKDAGFNGESNDCTVRALSTATGVTYQEAHAFLAQNGRRQGRGVAFTSLLRRNGNKALGHSFIPTQLIRSRGLRTALLRNPQLRQGTWILHMTSHVATLQNGRLLDSFDSSRKDIKDAWQVFPA